MNAKQYRANVTATGLSTILAAVAAVLFWRGIPPLGDGLSQRARTIATAIMVIDSAAMAAITVYRYFKLQEKLSEQPEDRQ